MEKNKRDPSNPLEAVLKELEQLINFAKENATGYVPPGKITPELEKKVAKMEKNLEKFKLECKRIIAESNIDPNAIDAQINQPTPDVPKEHQDTVKKLTSLKKDAEEAYDKVRKGIKEPLKQGKKKKFPQAARKNKFKQFGSDQEWKRL